MKKIKNNHHGFLALPRQTKLIINDLGYHLFGFYICLAAEAVWHREKADSLGQVNKTQKEIAAIFGCSQSTVSRNLHDLEAKKYLVLHDDYILLTYYPLFLTDVAYQIHSKDYANLHELYADMHSINALLQDKYAKSHKRAGQNTTQSFDVSYKGNVSSSDENVDIDDIEFEEYLAERNKKENGGGL